MKILIILPTPYPANRGTPGRVYEMSELLIKKGHEVHIICYHHGINKQISATIHRIPKTPFYKSGQGPSWDRTILDVMLFFKALQICFTKNIDVFHCFLHEGVIIGLPIAKVMRKPVIFDIQSSLQDELLVTGFIKHLSIMWKFFGVIDRLLPRYVNFNSVAGRNLEEKYKKLGITNIKVVQTCTDLNFFKPSTSDFKKRYGLEDKIIVGYQGSMATLQNVGLIVKIADRIISYDKTVKFLIGYTSDPNEIQKMVAERGLTHNFLFVPSKYEQAPELINACDIMLIPRRESFGVPIKLINFMACGKPVVMFKSVSMGVIDGTINMGVICEVEDEQQFQQAVSELIGDEELRRRYSRNARKYALQEFSPEKTSRDLGDIYQLLNVSAGNKERIMC